MRAPLPDAARRFAGLALAAAVALTGCGGAARKPAEPGNVPAEPAAAPRAPAYETDDGVIVRALPPGETSASPLPSQTVAAASPQLGGSGEAAPRTPSPAVGALLRDADAAAAAGAHDRAAASIERALKVEPGNAALWRRLAQEKLAEGRPRQAENLAKRSSALAPGDRALLISNWQLIAQARDALGDGIGANEALAMAAQLE